MCICIKNRVSIINTIKQKMKDIQWVDVAANGCTAKRHVIFHVFFHTRATVRYYIDLQRFLSIQRKKMERR
jgi:hypothetical protein